MINDVIDALLHTVQSVDPVLRTALAGVAVTLETSVLLGVIVPGDTVVLIASTAVRSPAEYAALVAVVVTGALLGESGGFALGRWFGPWIRASRLGRWIGQDRWDRASGYLSRRGGIAIFVSRFLPVLHSLVPLTVGASGMRYRTFLAWTSPACVVWAFAYVTVGSVVAEGYRQLSGQLHWAGFAFVGAIVVAILVFAVARRLIARSERHYLHGTVPDAPADPAQPVDAAGPAVRPTGARDVED